MRDGTIAATGASRDLLRLHPDEPRLDASGCAVLPGFVDPHTHVIWAGDRAAEFEHEDGRSKVSRHPGGRRRHPFHRARHPRRASLEELVARDPPRLERMFAHGTTTAEAKTGYGLQTEAEIKMLAALLALDAEGPLELALTFLGAHAVPTKFKDDPQGYTDLVCH